MEKKSEVASNLTNTLADDLSQLKFSFKIPYDQLKLGKQLGEGGYGVVYQATYLHADVAVKQLKSKELGEQAQAEWLKETQVMIQLRSPFIVQLYGVCAEPGHYSMVMEYLPKGSLFRLLQSSEALDWKVRYQMSLDIGKGITFLHAHKIIHRDLKSLNVLLDVNYRAKLCDFGLAKVKTLSSSTQTSSSVGTLGWMAPELFKRKAVYSDASDIYSYGMVLWEIAARRIPFEDAHGNQSLIIEWISKGEREEIPEEAPQSIKEAIQSCWQAEPEKRPTASQVIEQLQLGFETFQLQSLPKYPDNFDSQVVNLPSKATNSSTSSPSLGSDYPDNFASAKATLSSMQAVTSGAHYVDNLASQNKTTFLVSKPQYLLNTGITTTVTSKQALPILPPEKLLSSILPLPSTKADVSEPIFSVNAELSKVNLPNLELEDTSENLVQAAQSLIRGRNWTPTQKAYFQTLIETISLPPIQTMTGHSNSVYCLLLLPSGEVVSGSLDNTLKVWDIKTGKCVQTLPGHSSYVLSLLLLPNGDVVSGAHREIKVWNMKTGQCVKTLTGHSTYVDCLLLLPSGEVVSGSYDKTLKVWDMKTGQCVKTLTGHSKYVRCLVLLPGGEVVSGSDDKTLKVWDMKTGQCVKTLEGHSSYVNCLLVLPSGNVVSGSNDKTLKVWDMKTAQCVKTLTGHVSPVHSLRLISSNTFNTLVSSTEGEIKRWNLSQYTCEHTYVGMQGAVHDVWLRSPTECLLASGSTLERISWQPYESLRHALTQSTQPLAYASYRFFTRSFKRQVKRLSHTLAEHSNDVNCLLPLPSGEVVSGSSDKTLKVWDMKTGQCVKTLTGHNHYVNCLLLLPSGEMVSGASDKTLKVWDIKTGQCVKTLEGHSSQVNCLLLLPSGEVVSGSDDKTLKVWDIKTGQCVKTLEGHSSYVYCLLLLPSGEVVSGSSDKTLKVWNMKMGQCVKTLAGHSDRVTCLVLGPNREVVSASRDKTLKVWNMKTGECVKTLTGHSSYVNCVLLLPSGEVVSGSGDSSLKVWDMKTGECVKTLEGHEHAVNCLLLLPSGEVVSGSEDKTLKVWDINLDVTLAELETQAPECKQM